MYRIAEGLSRLRGFYTSESKAEFVVIDAIVTRDRKLNAADRRAVAEVARVRADGQWPKREVNHGDDDSEAGRADADEGEDDEEDNESGTERNPGAPDAP